MDRRFLAILAAIILIFVGIFALSKGSNNQPEGNQQSQSNVTSHIKGEGREKVTLTEYGDYQCPVCQVYEPVVREVFKANSDKMFFQFSNLPLVSVHPNAFAAARAAEAAGLQNKFWEMHDLLYDPSNWNSWTASGNVRPIFDQYAQQLGLNVDQFKKDFESSKVNEAINADIAAFNKTGQQMATPSFFINGRFVSLSDLTNENNQPTLTKFQALLDAEYAKTQ